MPGIALASPVGRVVAQQIVLDGGEDGVDPEAVDAAPEPEAHHLGHRLGHGRVAPVQIGLLRIERVEVELLAGRVPCPGAAAERRLPVRRRSAEGRRIGPDVPVALGALSRRAALDEPRVIGRGVARDEIQEEAHPARVACRDQRVEIGQGAVLGRDVGVVADVVTEVVEWRGIHRREPDGVHAQRRIGPRQVIEAFDDAAQVADAVTVRIGEAARVDLVDDRAFPPAVGRGRLTHRPDSRPASGCRRRPASRPRAGHPGGAAGHDRSAPLAEHRPLARGRAWSAR